MAASTSDPDHVRHTRRAPRPQASLLFPRLLSQTPRGELDPPARSMFLYGERVMLNQVRRAGSFAPATGRRPARISSPLSSHSHSGPAFWQRTTKPCCRPTTEGRGSLAPLQNRHDVDAADIAGHQRVISLDREPLMVRDRKPGLRQHVRLAHVILRRRGKQSAAPGPSADFRGVDRHRFGIATVSPPS